MRILGSISIFPRAMLVHEAPVAKKLVQPTSDMQCSPGVHVIKATQYTRLKATPKNTGKKATKIYRNIGYNEYTGLKATAFLNTQEKRLHFLNIQEKRLHFSNIQEKGYTF